MFLNYKLISKNLIIPFVLTVILYAWIPLVADASSTISHSLIPISLTNKINTSDNTTTTTPIEHLNHYLSRKCIVRSLFWVISSC